MAVQYRDYYEILGVSKDASQDEIKKAFKKLARTNHPDVAKDQDGAEERFKEINEAYEVLGDAEKRKKYDLLGSDWDQPGGGGGGFSGFPGGGGGGDFHFGGSTGFSDFFESMFGGGGARGGGDPFSYGYGGGQRTSRPRKGQDIEADLLVRIEEVMNGATREIRLARPTSDPTAPRKESTIRVKIPKGINEGQSIRCAGMGYPGSNGGKTGDLYLKVRLERHPEYRVRGKNDLVSDLILAPWEAALGLKVPVSTPHGAVTLTIKPNTQASTEMRLRGKGLPKKNDEFGDLYVSISIAIPETTSSEEMELWEKLKSVSSFRPRE